MSRNQKFDGKYDKILLNIWRGFSNDFNEHETPVSNSSDELDCEWNIQSILRIK